eukprot:TRINITY_DN4653_c0_g1_i8.p1 TRINITY_DN4653_c0_g1~~TRINITY_DN4653_c0_g1_i8.p1  ORF type:complete len:919 (-),score=226.83 TRINITY_DN4653_c0_g1_i8:34-2394(-)
MPAQQRYIQQYNQYQYLTQQFQGAQSPPNYMNQTPTYTSQPPPPYPGLITPPASSVPASVRAESAPSRSHTPPMSQFSLSNVEEQLQQSTLARKSGWLDHAIVRADMSVSRSRGYFVLVGHLLMHYPKPDPAASVDPTHELIEAIDLSSFRMDIASDAPFSFVVRSTDEFDPYQHSESHQFYAASAKDAVEWLVAAGQKTADFSPEREANMVDNMLAQADSQAKPPPPVPPRPHASQPPTTTPSDPSSSAPSTAQSTPAPSVSPSLTSRKTSISKFLSSFKWSDPNSSSSSSASSSNTSSSSRPGSPSPSRSPNAPSTSTSPAPSSPNTSPSAAVSVPVVPILSSGKDTRPLGREERKWLSLIAQRKGADPRDLIMQFLAGVLRQEGHPFGAGLANFVHELKQAIVSDSPPSRAQTCEDIRAFVSMMLDSILTHYTEISDSCTSNNALTFTRAAITDTLFPFIYDDVFYMYVKDFPEEDAVQARKNNQFLTLSPAHLAIKEKFWLHMWADEDNMSGNGEMIMMAPYQAAVDTLKKLPTLNSPVQKVRCLVQTADAIYKCIQDHWKGRVAAEELVVGGDELLPIFSYVVIKANIPGVYSESMFMQDYIGDEEARTLEGYLLVTFQTALAFVCCLEAQELFQNVSQIFTRVAQQAEEAKEKDQAAKDNGIVDLLSKSPDEVNGTLDVPLVASTEASPIITAKSRLGSLPPDESRTPGDDAVSTATELDATSTPSSSHSPISPSHSFPSVEDGSLPTDSAHTANALPLGQLSISGSNSSVDTGAGEDTH